VTLDANADFRQPGHAEFEDRDATDPLELKAKQHDLNYVKLDGQVGIIGNGAGLVMSTLDVVAYAGESMAGSSGQLPGHRRWRVGRGDGRGPGRHPGDKQVKSVFVNVFGGITSCDAVANGIVSALKILGAEANKPLVVRLDGNNVEEGRRILAEASTLVIQARPWTPAPTKRRAGQQVTEGSMTHVYFLNKNSKVIVQGITAARAPSTPRSC